MKPLNERFTKAVDYHTYRLLNRSHHYGSEVARRISRLRKRLEVQLKTHTFSGADPIAVLAFLARYRLA